jgi:hypothetical protein
MSDPLPITATSPRAEPYLFSVPLTDACASEAPNDTHRDEIPQSLFHRDRPSQAWLGSFDDAFGPVPHTVASALKLPIGTIGTNGRAPELTSAQPEPPAPTLTPAPNPQQADEQVESLAIQLGSLAGAGCALFPLTRPITKYCIGMGAMAGQMAAGAASNQSPSLVGLAWTGTTSVALGEVARQTSPVVNGVLKPGLIQQAIDKTKAVALGLISNPQTSPLGWLNRNVNLTRPIQWAWHGARGPQWGRQVWNGAAQLPGVRKSNEVLTGIFKNVSQRVDQFASTPASPLWQCARGIGQQAVNRVVTPLRWAGWSAGNAALYDLAKGDVKVVIDNDVAVGVFNAKGGGDSRSICVHSPSSGLITACAWGTGPAVRGFWPFDSDFAMPYVRVGTPPNNPLSGKSTTIVDPLRANLLEVAVAAKFGPNWLNESYVANLRVANANLNPRLEISSSSGPALVSYFTLLQPNLTTVLNVGPFSYTTRDMAQGIGPGWQWGGNWTFKGAYENVKRHALWGLNAGWNKQTPAWDQAPSLRDWMRSDQPGVRPPVVTPMLTPPVTPSIAPVRDVSANDLVADNAPSVVEPAPDESLAAAEVTRDAPKAPGQVTAPPTRRRPLPIHPAPTQVAVKQPRPVALATAAMPHHGYTDAEIEELLVGNDPFFGIEGVPPLTFPSDTGESLAVTADANSGAS